MNSTTSFVSTPTPSLSDANFSIMKHSQAVLHSKNNNVLWIHNKSKPTQQKKPYWKMTEMAAPKRVSLKSIKLLPNLKLSTPLTPLTPLSEDTDTDYFSSSSFTMRIATHQTQNNYKVNTPNVYCDSTDYNQSDTDEDDDDDDDDDNNNNTHYHYPWSPSSDDSFVDLSEQQVYAKLNAKFRKEAETLKISIKMTQDDANEENESESLDLYFDDIETPANGKDPKTGRYLSFIIKTDAETCEMFDDEYSYEGDNEDDVDFEDETLSAIRLNTTPIHSIESCNYSMEIICMSPITPMQSICSSLDMDLSGCSLSDIE